jgi:phosphopantothenoylcysteine decarboxylase / phosphopantothenate---cysteine ligase
VSQRVMVGIGGGIAAYKSAGLCSLLMKQGYEVQVLMTENATRFVQPITFQSLTKKPVVVDTFAEPNPEEIAHIAMADLADVYVIAPATANLIAKLAHGIADDMVTTSALALTAPLVLAPAMNVHMYEHPAVQDNLHILRKRGAIIVNPGSGPLACGYTGKGRLAEPEDIVQVIQAVLNPQRDFAGLRVLVTAGPTIEDIDPVRYLSNASSGKMGYAIAAAAVQRGASVQLISGPTHLAPVDGAEMVHVRSTEQMLSAVTANVGHADVYISAAAPADFKPAVQLDKKWKKSDGTPVLALAQTPDILAAVGQMKQSQQVFVGFAAETNDAVAYGAEKLKRKNLDMVVVNDVSQAGAGFGVDTNQVVILRRDKPEYSLPLLTKQEVAEQILDEVISLHAHKNETVRKSDA